MSHTYQRKTDRLNRSFYCIKNAGASGDPYKLLAAAIIFQAAVDCSDYDPAIEAPNSIDVMRKGVNCRFTRLRDFINSDWIDLLLCWQHEITPEGVCEELARRLTT